VSHSSISRHNNNNTQHPLDNPHIITLTYQVPFLYLLNMSPVVSTLRADLPKLIGELLKRTNRECSSPSPSPSPPTVMVLRSEPFSLGPHIGLITSVVYYGSFILCWHSWRQRILRSIQNRVEWAYGFNTDGLFSCSCSCSILLCVCVS
jgi:hypothetical protein